MFHSLCASPQGTCMCMYVHVCTCMYMYVHVCTCMYLYMDISLRCTLCHTATHCNTLQHTATRCNTLHASTYTWIYHYDIHCLSHTCMYMYVHVCTRKYLYMDVSCTCIYPCISTPDRRLSHGYVYTYTWIYHYDIHCLSLPPGINTVYLHTVCIPLSLSPPSTYMYVHVCKYTVYIHVCTCMYM